MIKKIIGTLTTRLLIAGITLLILFVNANVLGKERMGIITQFLLAITIIQLVSSIVGGGSLVYLVPRAPVRALLVPSYLWGILVSVAGSWFLSLFETTRADGYMLHVLFLSLLLTFSTSNLLILMGRERIRTYNIITLFQIIILFLILMMMFFGFGIKEISSYIIALYFSYGIGFVISGIMIFHWLNEHSEKEKEDRIIRKMLDYGATMQSGNILQFLNYRLSYFFIRYFLGLPSLGIYGVGNNLSESLWILGKSISQVQYSRISNEEDHDYAAKLTLTLTKICFVITFFATIFLLAMIFLLFPWIFKPEYEPVKLIMLILSPGILTFSVNVILSPYFSGSGRAKHNSVTAGIGLVFTLITGLIFIPWLGLAGAALSATISYSCATVYQFLMFVKISGFQAKDFLLKGSEIKSVYRFLVSLPVQKILR